MNVNFQIVSIQQNFLLARQMPASMHIHTAQRVNAAISTEHFIESNGGITDELDKKEAFID